MVSLVTMNQGHTVAELFTPENIKQWQALESRDARRRSAVLNVVTPAHRAGVERPPHPQRERRSDARSRGQDPRRRARPRAGSAKGARAAHGRRDHHADAARQDPGRRAHDSTIPSTSNFLLYDNTGQIRKPLLAFFPQTPGQAPTSRHAQMVVRLAGNQSIKDEGAVADFVTKAANETALRQRADHHHRRARAPQERQRLPHRRHGDARRDRDRDHGV